MDDTTIGWSWESVTGNAIMARTVFLDAPLEIDGAIASIHWVGDVAGVVMAEATNGLYPVADLVPVGVLPTVDRYCIKWGRKKAPPG